MYYVIMKSTGEYVDTETTPIFVTTDKNKADIFVDAKTVAVESIKSKLKVYHNNLREYRSKIENESEETIDMLVQKYQTNLRKETFGRNALTEDEYDHYINNTYYTIEEVPEL